ncbi:zinc transporter ZIP13 homolog [Portunus trituberculatus]|uniref:zinc transporter ZIP13 homolog n=1 Tax=Portunus trituberculatus TaxID=210409 RepID=UPI001E1CDFE7|nr:zinc transporter ZIP13 homolog [Portunus trituberculatus]XP_045103473.1 zinc transporter ZIP13 homolog [Portunus trituberculatus]XP_045103474.1 zinc transporter ZIP13 homolog [Portunus trituberculatus]XP_045103476.1 zinc transporter ZIP13 homolog [Portunus trituberculatus]XP_045103477.1 zinc transporter ZIP13 homolog [Portunus trituberculatus]XP_045103478.1 zinc transporter ZIP13 homolog [Portunus trituberculatus]
MQNSSPEWPAPAMGSNVVVWPPWPSQWLEEDRLEALVLLASEYQPWVCSVVAAIAVGLAGVVPLLFLPTDHQAKTSSGGLSVLPLLLSFAVGGLLGDVFLHLLPEAWSMALEGGAGTHEAFTQVGLCVLAGIFVFIVVEMLASHDSSSTALNNNNNTKGGSGDGRKEVTGYLNLVANGIDNFTHGLAVAGSFMVSYKTGLLTTAAILIHEVPHEIGDFAILLKSGFSRWEATKAQFYTATVGLVGALVTLFLGSTEILGGVQVYILGFTAGGFLNIALVTVLPDLLQEDRPAQSCAQLLCLLFGTLTMATVALTC